MGTPRSFCLLHSAGLLLITNRQGRSLSPLSPPSSPYLATFSSRFLLSLLLPSLPSVPSSDWDLILHTSLPPVLGFPQTPSSPLHLPHPLRCELAWLFPFTSL